MAQHMLLIVVAAPLLAAGSFGLAGLGLLPVRRRARLARWRLALRRSPVTGFLWLPVTAWLAHVLALWGWHLPGAYDAALRSPPLHLLEHACFLLTAWAFWWHVLRTGRLRMPAGLAVLYVAAVSVPSAALGAVLTFASRPLYLDQARAALAAGVDPLVDQQLAGLVMWVPADVVYLAVTVVLFLPWLAALSGGPSGDTEPVRLAPGEAG
jgi:cytochrome c oxidase assembly factor CtaG